MEGEHKELDTGDNEKYLSWGKKAYSIETHIIKYRFRNSSIICKQQ